MRKFLIIAVLFLFLTGCTHGTKTADLLFYDREKSAYVFDFEVKENEAFVPCEIFVTNNTSGELTFSMEGDFNEDYKNHLVSTRYVTACLKADPHDSYSLDTKGNQFTIAGNETKVYDVIFIGVYGGNNQKMDREPPHRIAFIIH